MESRILKMTSWLLYEKDCTNVPGREFPSYFQVPLKAYMHSDKCPTSTCLDQHFICRNRECTHVIESAHWLRDILDHDPKQGQYMCPKCLTLSRPFAGYKHNAGPQAKQFLTASANTETNKPPKTARVGVSLILPCFHLSSRKKPLL